MTSRQNEAIQLVPLTLALIFIGPGAEAQPATLIRDINRSETSLQIFRNGFSRLDELLLFDAALEQTGVELWKTDGTALGTSFIRDLVPGTWSGRGVGIFNQDVEVVRLGEFGYFLVINPDISISLWRTDGSATGTTLVRSFGAAYWPLSSGPVTMGDHLYFSVADETVGWELWKSDGTDAGTVLVRDIAPGAGSSSPRSLTVVDTQLFFTSDTSTTQLWRTDGSDTGTILLRESPSDEAIRHLTSANGQLYFFVDGVSVSELWTSDGSVAGTEKILDLPNMVSFYSSRLSVGSLFYFVTQQPFLLWRSDGTPTGTFAISNSPDGPVSLVNPTLGNFRDLVFFTAGSFSDPELWSTDGTEAGTRRVKPGVGANFFAETEDSLFISGSGQLWSSDGSEAGTTKIADVLASNLTPLGDIVVFSAGEVYFDSSGARQDVWRTDGTPEGTFPLTDHREETSSNPSSIVSLEDRVVFSASEGAEGGRLWTSDGTSEGTNPLADLHPVDFAPMLRHDDQVWFNAGVLYRSDGTPSGTVVVNDDTGAPAALFPLTVWNGNLLLRSADWGFWILRPKSPHPELLHEFDGLGPMLPLRSSPDLLLFKAGAEGVSDQIWVTDGTVSGTRPLAELLGETSAPTGWLVAATEQSVFFLDPAGVTLWRTNGTASGTMALGRFEGSVLFSTIPREFGAIGDMLLFGAPSAAGGNELWRSDGTPAGTVLLRDIRPGPYSSRPRSFVSCGPRAFFVADTELEGAELWTTDGTADGTRLVREIARGRADSDPADAICVGRHLYFSAADESGGRELWTTDGTSVGTLIVADVEAGEASSSPANLSFVGNSILFAATTAASGRELWRAEVPVGHPSFELSNMFVNEMNGAMQLRVFREAGTVGPLTVDYFTTDGTATAGSDYGATMGRLVWNTDDSSIRIISIPILADDLQEGDETFSITVRVVGAAPSEETSRTITIADVTAAGVIEFEAEAYSIPEYEGSVTLTLLRTGGVAGAASAHYVTESGSALADDDFVFTEGDVYWPAGDSSARRITIPIARDGAETDETFTLRLISSSGAGLGASRVATVTILEAPVPSSIPTISPIFLVLLAIMLSVTGLVAVRRAA